MVKNMMSVLSKYCSYEEVGIGARRSLRKVSTKFIPQFYSFVSTSSHIIKMCV